MIRVTRGQLRVLAVMCEGRTNKEIAAELHLSAETVRKHLYDLMNRVGASNRTELAYFAFSHGLVECPCRRGKPAGGGPK